MLRKITAFLSISFLLAFSAGAQEKCSSLDIQTTSQPAEMFDLVTIEITDSAPQRPTWLIGGISNTPTSVAYGPNLILNVDISVPILNAYIGLTDENGNYKQSYNIPRNLDLTLYVQTVTLDFERMGSGLMNFDFCTSNSFTMLF